VRVAVIGAGIVGVTTAYELALAGHEVVVFERRASVAAEGSFANAGVVAPGYITPWAAPGMPLKVLRHLLSRDAPVRLGGLGALRELPWMWRWWRACRRPVHNANRAAMHRLATFSRARLQEITRTLDLDYEQVAGYLVLLRTAREAASAQGSLALLREWGVMHEFVDAARARLIEPGLSPATALQGAIHLPQDGVGNCRQFAHAIKTEAQRMGVRFHFDTVVRTVHPGAPAHVETTDGRLGECEAVVICAGVQANTVLRGLRVKLPLAPVHGYSVTAPLRAMDGLALPGPRAAVMDERYKIAITRLGQRVRVAGSAELGGDVSELAEAPLRTLYRVLEDWFPGAAVTREAQQWKGARPMLPDGPPILGESGAQGVWLNLGHGSSGWALACGSARVLAERVSGHASPIDLAGLTLARLR
jgi:D-amino-acid dehydrogenase